MRDAAYDHPLVRAAALVGYMFKTDPLAILNTYGEVDWAIRLACYQYISDLKSKKNSTDVGE